MSRPQVKHDGFIVPNARTVADPVIAEPDQIDFNTLANARWGVIEGCKVNAQGGTAVSITAGTVLVNGTLVRVTGGEVPLSTPGTNPQFQSVVVNDSGTIYVKPGNAETDPVFYDPALTETLLATVYTPTGQSDFSSNIVDKRKLLPDSLLTKIDPTKDLIRNVNDTGNHFVVNGAGKMTWEGDTVLERWLPNHLRITSKLTVSEDLGVGDAITCERVVANGTITGSNLRRGTALPGTGTTGDLFVNYSTGRLYIRTGGTWKELITAEAAIPIGTIISSLEPSSVMQPLGWCPINGQQITETAWPGLFTIAALSQYIVAGTPRKMNLPDLTKRTLMVDFNNAGKLAGPWSNNKVTLAVANMPAHDHDIGIMSGNVRYTGTQPAHDHPANIEATSGAHPHEIYGGKHYHDIVDPGHKHRGVDSGAGPVTFITLDWGGTQMLDPIVNDGAHTTVVDAHWYVNPAFTGIQGTQHSDFHHHTVSGGAHDHVIYLDPAGQHNHTINAKSEGSGTSFDITPEHFTIYAYIKG